MSKKVDPRLKAFDEFCREVSIYSPQPLHEHAFYRQLQLELPCIMSLAPKNNNLACRNFLVDLFQHYVMATGAEPNKDRKDKRRIALRKDIDGLVRRLWNAPWLALDRQQILILELQEASKELKKPLPRQKRSVGYPELERFAQRFFGRHKITRDANLLLEFARWTGIECDERTAQRYLEDAKPPAAK
jgi:hypothetical protein